MNFIKNIIKVGSSFFNNGIKNTNISGLSKSIFQEEVATVATGPTHAETAKERLKFMMLENKKREFTLTPQQQQQQKQQQQDAVITTAIESRDDMVSRELDSLSTTKSHSNSNLESTTIIATPSTSSLNNNHIAEKKQELSSIKGVGGVTLSFLNNNGITTIAQLSEITDEQCTLFKSKVKHINNLRKEAQRIISQ
ncbi:hypothetical protein CYY_004272 [Polysphondylium violaceum]|uniref:Uncharacterized protein n=1 Tax=Polysphondylium violaceum TaxID=133409 RepID=A0A8J4UT45_9MYCE|nr:hypothetical protein CYY_004272 [Polysphondylium violaceum]